MGGDEFAVIAVEHGENSDELIYSRLQKNLDSYNQEVDDNRSLSMSIRIVHFDHKCDSTIDELLSRADTLMYEDKKKKKIESAATASGS